MAVAAPQPQLETGRGLQFKKSLEVHFPHDHVKYDSWGEIPDKDAPLKLPVRQVCHVTHQEQAQKIKDNDFGIFKPCEKYGKSEVRNSDDLCFGVSYRCTTNQIPDADTPCYQRILPTQTVLPGRYSWWGLSVAPENIPNNVMETYRPDYLKYPPWSIYGDIAFVSSFPSLLKQYADSRGCNLGDVCLRMGGTLRYQCHIAYVVIVCTIHDTELQNYKAAISGVFNPNGLINPNDRGRVILDHVLDHVPEFTTQHYRVNSRVHEALDFALYLEDNMRCSTKTQEVDCVPRLCPDQ